MSIHRLQRGTVSVSWEGGHGPGAPGIAQARYRDIGTRFEQVGVAWIKHGFFATNQSQSRPAPRRAAPATSWA